MGRGLAKRPFDELAIDFTVIKTAAGGRENVLIMIDIFSKFTQASPSESPKSQTVAKILLWDWFTRFGIQFLFYFDRGHMFDL